MPAKSINLLGQTDIDHTPVGKILRWALTYGRYIIVSTEIIVLLAFIYRFSLDRTLTDLNEEIAQKSAIITANQEFEDHFRNLQERVNQVGTLFSNQDLFLTVLHHLEEITPANITIQNISLNENELSLKATARTSNSLALFLNNLKTSVLFYDVTVQDVARHTQDTSNTIDFSMSMLVQAQEPSL